MSGWMRSAACIGSVLIGIGGCSGKPLPTPGSPSPADPEASWTRFHGPGSSNISPDTGLLSAWPADGPRLVWAVDGIGHGFSGVTLAGGLIYSDGNIDGATTITALDLSGRIEWQAENGPAWTDDYPGTRGTPTIDGERLYHESPLGNVVCLDAVSGDEFWSLNILRSFDGKNIKWALAESLAVDGDRVICCPFGRKASVVALEKHSGDVVWAAPAVSGGAGYASPIVVEQQGLRMVLTMNAKALVGVDADSGDLLFRHEHITKYDINATMPIFDEGHVFITSGYGAGCELLKIEVKGDKAAVKRVWKSSELDNHHGGVILWDGHLYGSSYRGRWLCLDWKTGQVKYKEKGVGKGSVTMGDGMLYMLNEKRKLGLARATPAGLDLTGSFSIPSGGEGPTWAHPVVRGGCLYVRHGDWLHAYDVRGEQTGSP